MARLIALTKFAVCYGMRLISIVQKLTEPFMAWLRHVGQVQHLQEDPAQVADEAAAARCPGLSPYWL
jgi:hypothetical protein